MLGLYLSTLKRMNPDSLLNGMVDAWLRRDDDVIEAPSWVSLADALQRCGLNVIASQIRRTGNSKFCISYKST